MIRTRLLTLVVVVSLLLTAVAPAVTAQEDPNFEAYVEESTLTPGEVNTVTVNFVNTPREIVDSVTLARNVRVDFREGNTPFTILSGTKVVGNMGNNQYRTVTARVRVPADAPAGDYCIPMEIYHEFDIKDKLTPTVCARVTIEERARFVANTTGSSVPVDGSGTVTLNVTNVGEEAATNASVALESQTADITFGQSSSASRFVGAWEPGETRAVEFEATASENAETRSYTLYTTVSYRNTDGDDVTSRRLPVGVTPVPEQTFELGSVDSSLRVGEEGTLSGTVTNTGSRTARNAVVVLQSTGETISPIETEYALGTLDAGASGDFEFTVEVTGDAESGPRQFELAIRYRDVDDEQRTSDALETRVDVAESRDEFDLQPVNASVAAGGSSRLEVTLTNTLDEPVTDVSAKLYVESPLSSSDDEAFVERLDAGESTTMTFQIGASGSALEKPYPVQMDFRYEDDGGDTRISETYQLPVQVTPQERRSSFPLPLVGGALVLVAVVAGVVVYRRRT